jgi:transcriptional regulator with XRE-family HTH domain
MRRRTVVDPRFGVRMRMLREERGRSLRDLEQPTLSSKSKLHNIETGATAPSLETARLIDDALQAGGALVAMVRQPPPLRSGGEDETAAEPQPEMPSLLASLRTGLAARRWPGDWGPTTIELATVEANVHFVHEVYQQADYPKVVTVLPATVAEAEQVVRDTAGETQRRAHRALALANLALSKLAAKLGDGPLAWITADRAASSALVAEDHLLWAAAAHQTGYALLRMPGRLDDAADVLAGACDDLDRTGPPADAADVSIRGSLRLLGGVGAARRADRTAARHQLSEAERLAGVLGEDGNQLWTGFGPTNVLIHRASVAVELHDPERAVELSGRIDPERLPPSLVSRRAQIHLNLAAAFAQVPGGDPTAVLHLLEAERIAPQLPGANHASRALLIRLVSRERRAETPGLRGLADRAGVLN